MLQSITPERRVKPLPRAARWDADVYLTDYYSQLEPTEKHTLRFLVDALRDQPPFERALEFGAGPTLHHAMALVAHTHELHIADLLPENLRAIRRWICGAPGAHDWSEFTREVLRLEGVAAPRQRQLDERTALLRRRATRVLPADARRMDPLRGASGGKYGCVASFFCADSATPDLGEWRRYVRNIAGLLAPGGLLIMGALRCCSSWRTGELWRPSPCIDECDVRCVLDSAGLEPAGRNIEVAELPDQRPNGFESILLVSARARRAGA